MLNPQIIESMEEAFVEECFTYGEDERTDKSNYEAARNIFIQEQEKSSAFAERQVFFWDTLAMILYD